jgi:hypothetical protein
MKKGLWIISIVYFFLFLATFCYAQTLPLGKRFIKTALTNRYLDVYESNPSAGTPLQLWDSNGGQWNQAWEIIQSTEPGYVHIRSGCGRYLDVQWGNSAAGTPVHIWDFNGGDAQKWKLTPVGEGYFTIQSKLGTFLDVTGAQTENGTRIQMWNAHPTPHPAQQWKFESAGGGSSVMTAFNPSEHGFKFINNFTNIFISEVNWTTSGLCGGMTYSALDYFNAIKNGKRIPQQDFMPAEGTTLQSYLYNRQVNSIERNIDKWVEYSVNLLGGRNREFFNWGIQFGNGRLGELRRFIDQGQPVPLGLKSCGNECGCPGGCPGDHQVLAIGYDLGRYRGDLNAYAEDVKIFVYDPNNPNEILTLTPNVAGAMYGYKEYARCRWRAYFVDAKYSPSDPPVIADNPNELIVTFQTGGDDLRGGNDNVHLFLLLRTGAPIRFNNVNGSRRWIDRSNQTIARSLPDTLRAEDIVGVKLETTFGGGIGGDNWNLDSLTVITRIRGKNTTILDQAGRPLFRFTGDQRVREFLFDRR